MSGFLRRGAACAASVTLPVTAAAAAVSGRGEERAPALALAALEVAVAGADRVLAGLRAGRRSWRCTCEQPGSRHSAPASRKTRSSPSASAWRLTCLRAGDDEHAHAGGDLAALQHARRPRAGREMRALVQLPMKTTSTGWPSSGCAGLRGPCSASAFSSAARCAASASVAGSGTRPVMGMPMPGLVPKVIIGSSAAASSEMLRSKAAPVVGGQLRASGRRRASQAAPFGACGRPARYCEGDVVGRDHAGARAALDRHVADRHALFHVEGADGRAGVLEDVAGRRRRRRCVAMSARMMSLAVTPGRQRARRRGPRRSSGGAGAGTASPARARPRSCRCRRRARRTRRGWRCGCRRRRSSCRAG